MDLLDHLTPRRIMVALGIVVGLRVLVPLRHYPVNWYEQWRYPPIGGPSEQGKQILEENERREAGIIEARYRRIFAELEQARAQGSDTSGLEAKARAALALNIASYRRTAIRMLSEVEMAVPRPRVQYIPMGPTEAPGEDIVPDVEAKPVEEPPVPARKAKTRRGRPR